VDLSAAPQSVALPPAAERQQRRYARLLDWGTRVGLALLLLSFLAYATGALPPQVALERLPELWVHPAHHYLELTGAPTGWRWIELLHHGDVLGLSGIAVLAGCSGLCVLSLLPLYHADGDRTYLWIGVAQVAVLLLAASGLLQGGH
jgi:hypothetical protein